MSDKFSFFDMDDNEMSAKGGGGTRQMHSYAAIDMNDKIETPEEDYEADKISEDITVSKLQEERAQQIPKQQMRI